MREHRMPRTDDIISERDLYPVQKLRLSTPQSVYLLPVSRFPAPPAELNGVSKFCDSLIANAWRAKTGLQLEVIVKQNYLFNSSPPLRAVVHRSRRPDELAALSIPHVRVQLNVEEAKTLAWAPCLWLDRVTTLDPAGSQTPAAKLRQPIDRYSEGALSEMKMNINMKLSAKT